VPWLLFDVVIGALAVLVLLVIAFVLYRHVRVLLRTVGSASRRVGEAKPPTVGS
jgi:hypothetical protein